MRKVLNRLNRRLQIIAVIFGIVTFGALSLLFGVAFKPQSEYVLLQDVLDPVGENRYSVSRMSQDEPVIGQFGPDDQMIYEKVLRNYLSGKLKIVDSSRIEAGVEASAALATETMRAVRLRSRVAPRLLLQNNSLAVFQVETDTLILKINPQDGSLRASYVETRFETIRIASTRLGLTIRHVEPTAPAVQVPFEDRVPLDTKLAGFNYYPSSAPWDEFWQVFPEEEIQQDFQRMDKLGANSIRIFLNRSAFESIETRAQSLGRLKQLLDLAEMHNLRVIVTCFDFGRGYSLRGLAEDWTHLDAILSIAANHDAVALFDLKNEPDLDFERWGEARVETWLTTLSTLAKASYPNAQITIGWSNAADAKRLIDYVDVVSFHDYEPADRLPTRIAALKEAAAGKAVMLTEIGHTKWGLNPFRQSQSKAYEAQLRHVTALDGIFVWTLNDFEKVPTTVAGWRPWRKAMQAKYGLDADSLALVAAFFDNFLIPQGHKPHPET